LADPGMSFQLIALGIILAGLISPQSAAIHLQVVLCLLGATAAVALPALGGATITPAALFLPFFFVRALRTSKGTALTRHVPRAGIWLSLLVAWGLISAVFLPRAFAGQTQILTVDRSTSELQVALHQLHPVSGNITQSAYLVGGFLAFVAARSLLANRACMQSLRDAVLLLAALNALAAALNLAEYWLGFPKLLPYLRTANYAMFDAYEEAGLVRIQGTFSETSAFSAFTLPLFAFCTSCWLNGERSRYSGTLALVSLALLLSSTSGTAYTGLAIYVTGLFTVLGWRSMRGNGRSHGATLLAAATASALAATYVVCFQPRVLHHIGEFFEFTVVNKLQSSSGAERTSWNQQALQNFIDTWGVGVGLGSARASSFILVLLSNLGSLGFLLFLGFLVEFMRSNVNPGQAPISSAARHAAVAALIAACVSGGVFDLGIVFYVFAAAASATRTHSTHSIADDGRRSTVANQDANNLAAAPLG
jgi:hypothetical protein